MRVLLVFESMFGNTQRIANAVAAGLSERLAVDMVEVGRAPTVIGDDVDLVVVGGPTHAFGMSRDTTREDAAKRAAEAETAVVSEGIGLREWLAAAEPGTSKVAAATFDTKISRPRVPGSAARAAHKRLRRRGFAMVTGPESFYVEGTAGPVVDGEVERARRWGQGLAAEVAGPRSARVT